MDDQTFQMLQGIDRKLDSIHNRIDKVEEKHSERVGSVEEKFSAETKDLNTRITRVETKASIAGGVIGAAVAVPIAYITSWMKGDR